jgi:hypothetical protein
MLHVRARTAQMGGIAFEGLVVHQESRVGRSSAQLDLDKLGGRVR